MEGEEDIVRMEMREYLKQPMDTRKDKVKSRGQWVMSNLAWLFLIIPWRLFHIFWYIFLYTVWYWIGAFMRKIGIVRFSHWWDNWIRRAYVPFFSWWFTIQFGFFKKRLVKVEQNVFDKIRFKYQGEKTTYTHNKRPFIIVSNHVSLTDMVMVFRFFGEIGIVGKASLKNDVIIGPLMKEIGCIFTGSGKITEKIKKRSNEFYEGKHKKHFLIYPEGTTTNGKWLLKFHRGAFTTGRAIQPFLLRYPHKWFDVSWAGVRSGKVNLFVYLEGLFSQFYVPIIMFKIPPYQPTEKEINNPELYAENVRNVLKDVHDYYLKDEIGELKLSNVLFVRKKKK